MSESRTALVVSYSDIATDPRVRREVDWLTEDGWVVDTLGLGGHPTDDVREHFVLGDAKTWLTTRIGTLISHTLLPKRRAFRQLLTDRVPERLKERIRTGGYALVVLNEYEFAPWVRDLRDFPRTLSTRLHLDIHEWRSPDVRRRTLGGRLTAGYYRWVRAAMGDPRFTSRSVVNAPIGKMFADEFGFEQPATVRNIPPFVDQEPSPVDPGEIRMLFHGMPSRARGFDEILGAMESLPQTFSMTFMLMPHPDRIAQLEAAIAVHPAKERIRVVPPAPMREIAQRINEYDLEIVFYRPTEANLEFALPNKFFESMQGRLGVVVGESPLMAAFVREHGNGLVVSSGFETADLAAALGRLTADDVTAMKHASHRAAAQVNAATEGVAFRQAVTQ